MTTLTLSSPLSAPPLYATSRNPQLATHGPNVDRVMALLGHPSMPWQVYVNAVANEVLEDGSFRYRTVVVSVPRQSGKTTLLGGVQAYRAMTQRDFRCWYTAQTGQAARDTWYEWQRVLSASMPGRWKYRLSNGEESARWEPTGSFIRTFPPTPESLHGKQGDFIALDEVFSFSQELGSAITQACVPTQATRPRRQLWIVSTAGDETSDWMRDWVKRGRESIDDPSSSIAHFEWAAPDDAPYNDPEVWRQYHPAFGLTQTEESFQIALEQLGEAGFRRAYLNQWPAAATSWRAAWGTLPTDALIPQDAQLHVAADSCPRHSHATITVAAQSSDRIELEVIDYKPGVEWVLPRLIELARRHSCPIILARTGPLGYLIPDLEREGIVVKAVTGVEYQDAVSRFQTIVVAGDLAHQDDPRLTTAVAAVADTSAERPTWRRKNAVQDISPLVSASLSVWSAAAPAPMPSIF